MCTVTLIARRNGYALGMNRDEKLTRPVGLAPRVRQINGREVLFPSEPNGGTWIGVNDTGATFALINWYSVAARVTNHASSRGEVVRSCLPADSPCTANQILAKWPLDRTNPFRLIGVFLVNRAVIEWRWNLHNLERREHPWSINTWISSGFDESGAQQSRGKAFARALRKKSVGSLRWLRSLHRSHGQGSGPYSHCMHRDDAATVSYTEIVATSCTAILRYAPGAPCCTVGEGMAPALAVVANRSCLRLVCR